LRMHSDENPFSEKAKTWEQDPVKVRNAKIFADEIINTIRKSSSLSGFEYGCGTGLVSFNLQPYLSKIILADSSKGMLEVASEKIISAQINNMSTLEIDLTSQKPGDEKFSIIYSLLTMHHIADVQKIFSTFYSMLESGGYLFIADLDKEDGSFHGKDFSGHNGFNRLEMKNWCVSAGFVDVEFKTITSIIRELADKTRKVFPLFLIKCRKC
ncbi:MAG TPA: class I SAM-dependent methyltransferase, partial [Chitinispirillaceae bacterium]|nr:class I SAM-dependent methyltransferase [Chitinispirillaceae bacterium]